jgi:hypothetical protein
MIESRRAPPGPKPALQPLDATETADFYQLCVERHQRASTVVTPTAPRRNGYR